MNAVEAFREKIPDYARDVKINIVNVLAPEGSGGLTVEQIYGIALASACATRNRETMKWVEEAAAGILTTAQVGAAKASASIMAMNNVYYRFLHLVEDEEYRTMPARIRMTVVGNPGIDKLDFELYSLAVSAMNGCGACIQAHARTVIAGGVTKEGVQSAVRIAAVIQSAAQVAAIEG